MRYRFGKALLGPIYRPLGRRMVSPRADALDARTRGSDRGNTAGARANCPASHAWPPAKRADRPGSVSLLAFQLVVRKLNTPMG